jgi:hypothetical protein
MGEALPTTAAERDAVGLRLPAEEGTTGRRAPGELPIRWASPVPAAAGDLRDEDMVLGVVVKTEARAYPVAALWDMAGHTVNDELGGTPVVVAMCPIAGITRAFHRKLDRSVVEFGSREEVDRGSLVLYDRGTGTHWDLLDGVATQGSHAGETLRRVPVLFTTWAHWKALHPHTTLHEPDDQPATNGIDASTMRRILLTGRGAPADRDWVVGFSGGDSAAAILVRSFVDDRVANIEVGDTPVVVFVTTDLTTIVTWQRAVEGRSLTFRAKDDLLVDLETRSSWRALTGEAVAGPLQGKKLQRELSSNGFWHAWKAHHPGTVLIDLD